MEITLEAVEKVMEQTGVDYKAFYRFCAIQRTCKSVENI